MQNKFLQDVLHVREQAELLITENEIHEAINHVASQIKNEIGDTVPLFLCVMKGGLMFTSELAKKINSAIELDYVHVDRYRDKTHGGSIHWHKKPDTNLKGRVVILVDDIFDEGYTMQELIAYCKNKGACKILSAVLLKKELKDKHTSYQPDFVGMNVEDRFVIGWGMDYKGFWRNLTDIYAIKS